MADNYLEKRMEEYRAGKLAPKSSRTTAAPQRKPGEVTVAFPPMNALVLCGDAVLTQTVCGAFRKADMRVAFCMADSLEGTRIAQTTGGRFYPYALDDVAKLESAIDDLADRWGGVDVIADLRGLTAADFGDSAPDMASLLLLHSHPAFSFVASTEVSV